MKKICLFLIVFAFFFTGCSEKRDTSTPEKALIGHWRSNDEKDMFFSEEGRLLILDGGGFQLRCKYKVSAQNTDKKTIKYAAEGCSVKKGMLSLKYPRWAYNSAQVELQFSPDFQSAEGKIIKFPNYAESPLVLTYVSDGQNP